MVTLIELIRILKDFKRFFRNLTNDDKTINKSVNQMLNSKGMKELLRLFKDGDRNL